MGQLLDTITQAPQCQRCRNTVQGQYCLVMSYFNTQMVCEQCERDEQAHPDYDHARATERQAIKTKNYDFRGIGLPESLKC